LRCINSSRAALSKCYSSLNSDSVTPKPPEAVSLGPRAQPLVAVPRFMLFGMLILTLSACSLLSSSKEPRWIEYEIKRGDTLSALAQRFGTSDQHLAAINGISDARTLQVGQVLRIPVLAGGASSSAKGIPREKLRADRDSAKVVAECQAVNFIGELLWPVRDAPVESSFGRRWGKFHEGLDLSAPLGAAIHAAHAGEVAYSGDGLSGYGNMIVLRSKSIVTIYAHNDRNLVRVGQQIKRGSVIALVGHSGRATGPHLHFEVRVHNRSGDLVIVDPLVFFPGS